MRLLCLGYGYVARAFARAVSPEHLTGTGRDGAAAARRLGADGGVGLAFDGAGAASQALITAAREASHVLISIPATRDGCPAFAALGDTLKDAADLTWVGYLSATSVYGDRKGGWCFEAEAPTPMSDRGRARAQAEAQWLNAAPPAHVFRLPGIYGPGRSPLDRARAGEARRVVKPGQVFSRVHRDDIAAALALSSSRPAPGAIYNIADDEPAAPWVVSAFAHDLLGLPAPPEIAFQEADLSPMARAFWAECKRISNAKAKAALGWRPAYRTYREGLTAILAGEDQA